MELLWDTKQKGLCWAFIHAQSTGQRGTAASWEVLAVTALSIWFVLAKIQAKHGGSSISVPSALIR